jgi:hypothetical protein
MSISSSLPAVLLFSAVTRAMERSRGTPSVVDSYMKPNIKLTRAMERSRGTPSVVDSYMKPNIKLTGPFY